MDLSRHIIDATKEIFTSMVMMEVTAGEPGIDSPNPLRSSITGAVGMAGSQKGMLAIHIPNTVAMAITSNFLGMEINEINADVQDAVGELANMLAGSIKLVLSESASDIKLSLPTTIFGEEYTYQSGDDVDLVIIPFTVTEGRFLVELRMEKES